MVPKPPREGAQAGKKTRRSRYEREGRPRVSPACTDTSRNDATASSDDEWHDASPSSLPPRGAPRNARAVSARRCACSSTVTATRLLCLQ